jgi:excisionase family DNA binding protein
MSRELSERPSGGGLGESGLVPGRVAGARTVASQAPVRDERGGAEADTLAMGQERLLTIEELAERLQYSVDWVRLQVRLGKIPAIRFNARAWRFHWPTVLKALHWLD